MDSLKTNFKKLTRQDKQKKLYQFVEQLDHWDETLHKLKVFLEKNTTVNENFLIDTYFDLLDFAKAIRENNNKKVSLKFKSIQEKLKNMAKVEDEEHTKADDILNMIE